MTADSDGRTTTATAPIGVSCVDPDGRLRPVVAALRAVDDVAVSVVGDVAAVEGNSDCCVLLHAPETETHDAVDGLAQLDEFVEAHPGVPVAVYGVDIESAMMTTREFARRVVDHGGDAAMTMAGERTELIVRRIKQVAGFEEHFQSDAALLDSLLESFPHQLFVKDDVGRFVDTSAVTAREYDFDREALMGLTDYELMPMSLAEDLYEEEQRIMATEEPMLNKVEHYVDAEGHSRWVNTTKAPRYDRAGAVTGIVGGTRDITEEKRQEHVVRAVHEASRDLVRAGDRTEIGDVTASIAEDIPALPRVQLVLADRTTGELQPVESDGEPSIYARYAEWCERAHERAEALFVLEDGSDAVTDWDAIERPAAALVPLGSHGVFGVTTGERTIDEFTYELANIFAANVEAALDRAERERELEHQNERLEEFTSIVSHDLRNPLSVASSSIELAKDDPKPAHLERADRALDRMEQLTEELLTLAKKGQTVGETDRVQLREAVLDTRESVSDQRANIVTEELATIEADRSRLVELLENLFRNAVEHGPADETDAVTVTVGMLADGFYVEDDGVGVPESEREAVFEMGYTGSDGGTGYGLYIVETIADAHGWSVRATESESGGARFEFTGVIR
ncbi:PAS domain-containing sensor histidine kinase [Halomicroarcula limicola]|uniref:histidine kinase n=1 Tax=Haloarcula limicola TaxID=1429915 RepID=A0A8J7Y6K6_9EURY|nr:ATP-binding protein [Halomicroarcula limicola]MBV0925650.1 PAS domain-containing sensor histidine kinase [Halomicroarcula limicola]